MANKALIVFLSICYLLTIPAYAYSGACDPSPGSPEERLIDGPANIRSAPSSKSSVIASLPNHKKVLVTEHKIVDGKDWYLIEWTEGGQKKSGWTFTNNIICD